MSDKPVHCGDGIMVYRGKRYRKDPAGYNNPFPLGGWVEMTDPAIQSSVEADEAIDAYYRAEAMKELDLQFPADIEP